jgi:alpha-beta hydrolase superfamily lysophospholipase
MKLEIISEYPAEKTHATPLLVIGAEKDRIFTVSEQRKTARAYHSEAILYPQAHDMMLEPGWGAVADEILEWLNPRNL